MSRVPPRVLALAALLLLAVVAARGAAPFTLNPLRLSGSSSNTRFTPPPNPPELKGQADSIGYLVVLLGVVGVLLAVAGLISLLAVIRRRHRVRVMVSPQGSEKYLDDGAYGAAGPLVQAGKRALVRLRAHEGGPPSDRVIAAWLSLERAATETGTGRQPHETPTEFVGSVLAGHDVNPEALDDLRRLYGRARFGRDGVMTDADADAAGDALDRIVADLEAAR